VSVATARGIPIFDEAIVLKAVQDRLKKISLLLHGCRKLTPYPFDGAAEEAAIVKLFFGETVVR
jgi:hypothetical protein